MSRDAAPSPLPTRDHCLAPGREADPVGGYGRMFDRLPALTAGEAFFAEQGTAAVRGTSSLFRHDEDAQAADDDLPAAGWPVFAQFLAHDLTADRSGLTSHAALEDLSNARAPRLDLECVYGSGPADRPYLVQRDAPSRMLLGGSEGAPDLPRNSEGVALVGDPRNDVHALISQLHVWMLTAHNALESRAETDGVPAGRRFAVAQQQLRWHHQWVVLHEFLDLTVGPELAAAVRDGGERAFRPGAALLLPVEFADAAFRYGHGQVRERYRLQPGGEPRRLFPDLVGFRPIGDRSVDPGLLFDLPGRARSPQRVKRLDGRLAASLIRLPLEVTGALDQEHHQSLAVRDLQRGLATGLPSGEAVARELGVEPLRPDQVGVAEHGWVGETPLWYYVLKEAEVCAAGRHLGPVGGRIVAEVLTAVVERDPTSYLAVEPGWSPPTARDGRFGLGDLLTLS
ncbi:MAG TPA: peroxidase family protein [Geodermatophilus sp.]|nr:peroxidase family protein [Geodermatophilus sp.]